LGPLVDYAVEMEAQLKNLINVVDVANVVNVSRMAEAEIYFIGKRCRVSPALSIRMSIDDVTLQTLFNDRELLKVRLDKTQIDFKMQDRGAVGNFDVAVKISDFFIID